VVVETISLKELIEWMDAGKMFSIGFRTFNDKLQTGGEWIEFKECVKHNHLTRQELKEKANKPREKVFKDPKHYENATRNIKVIERDGELVKVHLRLIRKFNGKTVL
jgi:hypothetical protein